VTKFARGQLTTVANELIEGYAGGDKPTPRTVRDWINERLDQEARSYATTGSRG
jgi:hypothetical protein